MALHVKAVASKCSEFLNEWFEDSPDTPKEDYITEWFFCYFRDHPDEVHLYYTDNDPINDYLLVAFVDGYLSGVLHKPQD